MLLASTVITPLVLAALLAWPTARRAALAAAPWAAMPGVICALWSGSTPVEAPALLLGMRLGLDPIGRSFLLFSALLWLTAGGAARAYHARDVDRVRLWVFWLLTLCGSLGLIIALDAASFYGGFALMTFAGYGLIVYTRSAHAWRAGRIYLAMALLGEMALLAGLLITVRATDDIALPLPPAVGPGTTIAALLVFVGFGVKAGLVGVHMWLPLAHPVAPTPASAVLSGVMIKAGVLGWLRFLPLGAEAWPTFGTVVLVLGLVAIFGAAGLGLTQQAPKTLLAYSSISQMGFLTIGIGAALVVPASWPALAAAVTAYALHHGLAKGALFLSVAAMPPAGRARAWALAALALPALALAGFPATSGALAKGELKNALAPLPAPWPDALSLLLPAGAFGTMLLLARFMVALRASAADVTPGVTAPWLAAVALSASVPWVIVGAPGSTAFAATPTLLAFGPVVLALALAAVVSRWRPFDPDRGPSRSAGDLLHWLEPSAERVWALMTIAAGWSDRAGQARTVRRAEGRSLVVRGEHQLRRPIMTGLALLLVLAGLVTLTWR